MLKNMKIRFRMLLSYAIVILLTVIAGVVAVVMLSQVGSSLTGFYDNQFQTVDQAWAARRGVYAARSSLLLAVVETDSTKVNSYLDTVNTESELISKSVDNVRKTFQGDTALLDQADGFIADATSILQQIVTAIKSDNSTNAYKIITEQYIPVTDNLRTTLIEVGKQADANAYNRVETGQSQTSLAIILVAVLAAFAAAVAIFFAIVISNSVRKPVEEIEKAALSLSEGRLDAQIHYQAKDELGSLANSMRITVKGLASIIADLSYLMGEISKGNFNARSRNQENYKGDFQPILTNIRTMNERLSDTMKQINESADQVSSGSEQVSSGAQALSQGATEQASSVEELAATINEISAQIKENASSAQQATQKADVVSSEMEESNQQMRQMTDAMTDISRSSGEIGKIIKTIEDIAFQTNILALNAAVEAARAGAAGKGFAVVADEVRNLASKSADASKNTSALIESSIRSVENGQKLLDQTAQSMQTAVDGVRDVTSTIQKIAQASNQQANSIMQITQGIDQISSVVQTNSATAEESAAASEELSAQSLNMKNLVSRFKLKTADGDTYYDAGSEPDMSVESVPDQPQHYAKPSFSSFGSDKY